MSRPAPPPSRYGYSLKIDLASLPEGVTIREVGKIGDIGNIRLFIANSSDVPLIIKEIFDFLGRLIHGTKLVSGKVYQYYPSGVPMEGLTHLKGWQAPFGDIDITILSLQKIPDKIYEGRQPDSPKDIPEPEPVSIPVNYNGQPYEIRGVIHYHLNESYDHLLELYNESCLALNEYHSKHDE